MLPFRDAGPKDAQPVLVLLHFFGGSHREWNSVTTLLQQEHRVVAADMAGFGEAALLEGYSVAAMERKIRELLQYLAPAPVVLTGHSMSGKAAMVIAASPEENLAGVVLVAPSPLGGEPMDEKARAAMRIANSSRERAEAFTRPGFAKTPDLAEFEIAVEDVLRSSDAAFHAWADHGTREDWSGRVTSFGVKTLLVVGEQDRAIDPEVQRKQTLPLITACGGRMHVLPDCAHLVPYEQPGELAEILHAFAKEVA